MYYGSGHLYNQSLTDEQGNIFEIRHSTTNKLHQEVTRQQGELLSSFGYDPMGRLVKQYSSNDKHIVIERSYAYDKVGQLTHIASSTRLTQAVAHRPNQVIVNHYQRNHQYQYDKLGRLTDHKLTDFNHHRGVQERFAFDPASNRVPLPHVQNNEQTSNTNAVNGQGIDGRTKRPTRLISQGKKIGYVYDKHGRVIQKTMVPVDKDGNELAQSQYGLVGFRQSLQLAYNANGELEKSIKIHQQGFEVTTTTTNYFYDAFGRRVAKSSELQKASKINQRGKLVRFPDSLLHLRVDEKANRQTMLMLWDGNRQIQEYTTDHVFTTVYAQDSFVPVARIVQLAHHIEQKRLADIAYETRRFVRIGESDVVINQRIADKSQPLINIYHYHCNHLGTPQELSDDKGDIIWLSYDRAWGGNFDSLYKQQFVDNFAVKENELQPFKFQGQSLDVETGLHYNRFRYYDSDVGMFISRDPIGLMGGSNSYQYAPNPIIWIDPTGLNKKLDPARQKCPTGKWIKPPEVIDKDKFGRNKIYETYNEARARAKQLSELNNVPTMPYIADMGPRIGEVVGSQSLNRYNHWRVDYDPASDKGFHINWRRIEKQTNGDCKIIRGVILVKGGEDAYLRQIERMPKL